MEKVNILDAVDTLKSALNKVEGFDIEGIQLSERVLDNRIITLEGYLRFLNNEGIPKLSKIRDLLPEQVYTMAEGGKDD
ncbi:MAG: hypothetical protein MI740_13085 [Halanaerobiales bacterium]|nr:hypothetical protein [Halanaerobiales bacterium]